MAFDVEPLFDSLVSTAKQLGAFEIVIQHEPKAAPVIEPALALWLSGITPLGPASGLGVTSARISLQARIYLNFMAKPADKIDPKLVNLTSLLIGAYSGGFTLGGQVREIDLLGMYGEPMAAKAGYIEHDSKHFRAMEISIPLIVNDLWTQVA